VFDTNAVFAGIVLLTALALALDGLVGPIERPDGLATSERQCGAGAAELSRATNV